MCLQNRQGLQKGKWQLADLGLHLEMLPASNQMNRKCWNVSRLCVVCVLRHVIRCQGVHIGLNFVLVNDRM